MTRPFWRYVAAWAAFWMAMIIVGNLIELVCPR